MEILELKEKLEKAINERLSEFKDRAERYEQLAVEMGIEHGWLIRIAHELKSVEYMMRASGNDAQADLVDQLLDDYEKDSSGKEEDRRVDDEPMERVLLPKHKKRR